MTGGAITVTKDGGFLLRVRLTPGAATDRIDGAGRDAAGTAYLAARVRARPEKGRANAALEELLAKAIGAPKSAVQVERGDRARMKTVRVAPGAEALSAARLLLDISTGGHA